MPIQDFFDETVASTYDRDHGGTDPSDIARTADVLFDLAGQGPALELAIGTGRIALPLQALGCAVKGIELSPAVVAELRGKETGEPIEVVIGDMAAERVDGSFSLVYLVFNTIDNLPTQDAQIACFRNAARHLKPGGRFVIETLIPPLQKIPYGETRYVFADTPEHEGFDDFDFATQHYTSHHVRTKDGTKTRLTIPFRYTWPSELDLMAKLAGLELEHRWGDWDRSAFTGLSTRHVSVWRNSS